MSPEIPAPSSLLQGRIRDAIADTLLRQRLAVVLTDPHLPDNPIVHASPGFLTLTGYDAGEVLGRNCRFLQGPHTDVVAIDRLRGALQEGRPITVDLVNYRKSGETFGNRLQVDPVRIDGHLRYFLGVQHEIPVPSSLDDDGRDILLRDLRHRVNGTMQLVISLLRLRMSRSRQPVVREALGNALEQLEAVMLVQRQLDGVGRQGTVDVGQAVAELARSLVAGFKGKVALDLDCAGIAVPSRQLEPLLLLANEAIVNALRHAFPAGRGGRIQVMLTPQADGGMELVIEDDGVGSPEDCLDRGGLGTMLMHSFARQLGGTLELTCGIGVRLCLRVPAGGGGRSA